ncbi:hypothetical protein MPUL_36430 [Mycolicibacterium pulveris]|uniref:Uncharacterized protein n=1 Tax=Mycolicibacterium pulveris TaxID=36813 RepID=A0A7I7UM78_MYCPV|nr:hypothetical protein MPUL_36430 [Mycolicibacterium pulveris]
MHVDLAQMAQLRDELGDVHPGPAVNLGWELPGHHRHPHVTDDSDDGRPPQPPMWDRRRNDGVNGWPFTEPADRFET